MPKQEHPLPLLTLRRISCITGWPVSRLRRMLDEHPEIQPAATADYRPVYDRDAVQLLVALAEESASAEEPHR